MNDNTTRALLVAGLCCNALFLTLALIDYALYESRFMWPIFVGWAFLILLIVILAFVAGGIRMQVVSRRADTVQVHLDARPARAPAPAASTSAPAPAFKAVEAEAKAEFPFVYNAYTLYSRDVELKGGGKRPIYFFAKAKPKSGHMVAKPAGYHVGVNERTGLPFLKKGGGKDGEDLTPEPVDAYRPQCAALTEAGAQCRNSAREASKYCISHFGYQPPTIAKAEARREDTLPRVKGAADTLPSVRRKSTG